MISTNCNKEHSTTAKECEETGNPLEPQFQYCNNECCDFRSPLPVAFKFCPNCGHLLMPQQSERSVSTHPKYYRLECVCNPGNDEARDKRYKIFDENDSLVSDLEFYIVDSQKKDVPINEADSEEFPYLFRDWIPTVSVFTKLLLCDAEHEELYFLKNSQLIKIGKYSDGYLESDGYDRHQTNYTHDACFITDEIILYRNSTRYLLCKIAENGKIEVTGRFQSNNPILCQGELCGDYINLGISSTRISDGEYETIPGYKRCRCIGYFNGEPIFVGSTNHRMIDCDIVKLSGEKLINYNCHNGSCWILDNYLFTEIQDDDFRIYDLKTSQEVYCGNDSCHDTEIADIVEFNYQSFFSLTRKQHYTDYQFFGDFYILIEGTGSKCLTIYSIDGILLYEMSLSEDLNFKAVIMCNEYGQYLPLVFDPNKKAIVNVKTNTVVYNCEGFEAPVSICSSLQRIYIACEEDFTDSIIIKVIDFEGNLIKTVSFPDYSKVPTRICSNGYILYRVKEKGIIEYYDNDFNIRRYDLCVIRDIEKKDAIEVIDIFNNGNILIRGTSNDYIVDSEGKLLYDGEQINYINIHLGLGFGRGDEIINLSTGATSAAKLLL